MSKPAIIDARQGILLRTDPTVTEPLEPEVKKLRHPVWTEAKAHLIERYLNLFVMVTRHGTYIDAFAGPQAAVPEMWSAKLVLESRPRWLGNFHLFETNKVKIGKLRKLVAEQPERNKKKREPKRSVNVCQGDCNVEIPNLLAARPIKEKEATFCLLDQRTFECHWATVKALAAYKTKGPKIELFYFLPNMWLPRSLAGLTKNPEIAEKWWGQADWRRLGKMTTRERALAFTDRFKELGYASVKPWPISERQAGGGNVMYFMIHATDHPDAPGLMRRAFAKAVDPSKPTEQLKLIG